MAQHRIIFETNYKDWKIPTLTLNADYVQARRIVLAFQQEFRARAGQAAYPVHQRIVDHPIFDRQNRHSITFVEEFFRRLGKPPDYLHITIIAIPDQPELDGTDA